MKLMDDRGNDMAQVVYRYNDVITESKKDAKIIKEFRNFPVNMLAPADSDPKDDPSFDMKIGINEESGVIQIVELLPNDRIYVDTHSNAIGGVWRNHHETVSKCIQKYSPDSVLEIGGGTGILESIYNAMSEAPIPWTIIEPQPHPIKETRASFIKGFFPDALPKSIDYDVLVHTHTIEHMYSPKDFMSLISDYMEDGKHMVFSVPNLKNNLEACMTSVLNFEHTIYFTDDYIDYLLERYGFVIESKQNISNHSIVYSTTRRKRCEKSGESSFRELYEKNYSTFAKWVNHHESLINKLNKYMEEYSYPVYLFGGHITTQFYIAFGLDVTRISGILDNDPYKWGKRVSGTNLEIFSPREIDGKNPVAVILPQSPYAEEIKRGIIDEHNKATVFWE